MIFDGKEFARQKEERLKLQVEALKAQGITPKMVSILADNSPETALYVSLKSKFAEKIGALYDVHRFDGGETQRIIEFIKEQNKNPSVHGIMVQLPVINENQILQAITPEKDADCLTAENLGKVLLGEPRLLPATVKATADIIKFAIEHLEGAQKEEDWLAGKNVCIIGASIIVGKPLAIYLSDLGATVTICHSKTENLPEFTKKADVVVSATGVTDLVTVDMVKYGAIVIDVGISKLLRGGKFRVMGDVDPKVVEKTAFLSPVPGGVGPVTVASLFENLLSLL
ncbi:MAG: bifunctional 5,10-methylenetetrahydrofolate dehydrogenase/5,10-methenyltetrahydrofolate cyclohydrolase [Patescibacteria group bacterium]|jgi:methylenetetrahydrofolate dehydrogenase (NADP+)/methenyltetrahydrofolate cyclohydrolase